MAKKYKSTKLLKKQIQENVKQSSSAFGKHANRLADSRKKKIQKLSDTQKRLMQSKKNNKMIKISKKSKKFALLDENDQQNLEMNGLTHKGRKIGELKQYDDVDFNQSDIENDDEFDQIHDKLNFAGFQATGNLLEDENNNKNGDNQGKQKTKTEIYKEIIEKSKAYKLMRQQIYEQNLQKANQLDQGFGELVKGLKFRNQDKKMLDKIQGRDLEYDRLMNELKDDERVVSNKIVQKNQKYTEKIRKKKNQQLNKLMRDSDGEEGDIRGWVDANEEDSKDEEVENGSDSQENEDEDENENDENQANQSQSYDELDDVNLSSSEQEEGQGQEQEQEQEQGQGQRQGQVQGQEDDEEQQLQDEQQQDAEQDLDEDDEQDESDQQQEQSEQSEQPIRKGPINKNHNNKNQQKQPISKNQPAKKRKLNTIY